MSEAHQVGIRFFAMFVAALLQHRNRNIFIWPVLSFEHPFLFNYFCARIFAFLILEVEFQAEQANAHLFQNACSIFVAILTRF